VHAYHTKEYGKVHLTCFSFGTIREGFPAMVTSKLMKTPMKMGELSRMRRDKKHQKKINNSRNKEIAGHAKKKMQT
jgi:hypothetical protein